MKKTEQEIVIICGPTATGKTCLALQLAKVLTRRRGGLPKANILSVDSRQVYRGLDIITGKDIPKNLPSKINIFGLDIFLPDENANLGDFSRYSKKILADSFASNTPLIIVGGTGLYLKAITESLSFVSIPPDQKLRSQLEKLTLEKLQKKLKKINQKKFSSLNHSDLMNPRRLIRQIEISLSPVIAKRKPTRQFPPIFHWIGLTTDKEIIKTSINKRVLERLKSGAIDEVKELLKKYPDRSLPIYTSLGVAQIVNFIEGKINKDQLIDTWTNSEADYARRQIVWFKKQPDIVWYDKDIDRLKLITELSKIYK